MISYSNNDDLFDHERLDALEEIARYYTGCALLDKSVVTRIAQSLKDQQTRNMNQPPDQVLEDLVELENVDEDFVIDPVNSISAGKHLFDTTDSVP